MSAFETLKDLPDVSFIDDISLAKCMEQMKGWWEEKYESLTGEKYELTDLDGDKLLLDACALMYYQVLSYIDAIGKQNLLKYSSGGFLLNKVADMRIFPDEGKKAYATVRFEASEVMESAYLIPAGTMCATEDDTFFVTEDVAEISVGNKYVDIKCVCTEAGEDGNDYEIGEINTLVEPLGAIESVHNITVSSGGEDPEDDESLAERRFLAPAGLNAWGGEPYYQYHVKTCNKNVGDIITVSPKPCYTDIRFVMKDGSVPDQETIKEVQDYLNDTCVREVGDIVTVKAPETSVFNIDLDYYINESDRKSALTIQTAVNEAVEKYAVWQNGKFGRDINPDKLVSLVIAAGAKRCSLRAPVYTAVDSMTIPVRGTVSVNYGGIEND